MEVKSIKEEVSEVSPCSKETATTVPRLRPSKGPKDRVRTPDSVENCPPRSSSGRGPVSPPVSTSPKSSTFQNGAPSPPLYSSLNGSAINVSPPLSLSKVKRFLTTLVQFGQDISPDTGEKVKTLVLSLVSNGLTVEEFHHSLQEVTNFPLRPFVLPFLRAYLPPLQREISAQARTAKLPLVQYLRQHEHAVLDPAFTPSEPSEIFHHTEHHEKRRASSSDSYYDNTISNMEDGGAFMPPASKRPHHSHAQSGLLFPLTHHLLPGMPPEYPPTSNFTHSSSSSSSIHRDVDDTRHRLVGSTADEEWKNIHVMLNCILSMVEKTKRALTILQQRSGESVTNGMCDWSGIGISSRRLNNGLASGPSAEEVKRTASEIMAHTIRITEDRVAEVKRKAEEAVNEVKRQAVAELQRAVAAAESKACELVASERAKLEKLVAEAQKKALEDVGTVTVSDNSDNSQSPPTLATHTLSQQNACWNCGRKANETCSGCNVARYCGAFCQHKDWETHHQVCCSRSSSSISSIPSCVAASDKTVTTIVTAVTTTTVTTTATTSATSSNSNSSSRSSPTSTLTPTAGSVAMMMTITPTNPSTTPSPTNTTNDTQLQTRSHK
ncbi:CBFA2/RUNX1 partner transcriptional co-repressor nervy [Lycorma delicatula]|uniref:CBFA2/RUNX1 partner transcriptional co-repressor nervy n=1 Tax=Lycorma delicatula TaxID=130591 RepID=UPI003F5189E9